MKIHHFLYASAVAAASLLCLRPSLAADAPQANAAGAPNIVVIVADDLGYHDLGVQGCKDVPTPHIDSLAREGVRFTNAYVTGPVCSPSRAAILTGRYQERTGHDVQPGRNDGLLATETTLADTLKAGGYRTGIVGKWNLGALPQYHPQKRGFDDFVGFLPAVHDYMITEQPRRQARADDPSAGPGKLLRGTQTIDETDYLTDVFAREAVSFIDLNKQRPYFLYLAFNAVHNPLQAPPKYLERFPTLTGQRKTYAAMLSAMDDAVGQVVAKVRETGGHQNTLFVFLSDNGGPTGSPGNGSDNTPLHGRKQTVWEGGVRVPFFVSWPGHVPAGVTSDLPVICTDIYPTALAAAGKAPPPGQSLDGIDLVPLLRDPDAATRVQDRPFFWRYNEQWAVRQGKWKLTSADGKIPQLFDLTADIAESKDLASANPSVVTELKARWDQWNAGNIAPRWADNENKANKARRNRLEDIDNE